MENNHDLIGLLLDKEINHCLILASLIMTRLFCVYIESMHWMHSFGKILSIIPELVNNDVLTR